MGTEIAAYRTESVLGGSLTSAWEKCSLTYVEACKGTIGVQPMFVEAPSPVARVWSPSAEPRWRGARPTEAAQWPPDSE